MRCHLWTPRAVRFIISLTASLGLQLGCSAFMPRYSVDPYRVAPSESDTTPELEALLEKTAPLALGGRASEDDAHRFSQLATHLAELPGARARALAWSATIHWQLDHAERAQAAIQQALEVAPNEAPYLLAQLLLLQSMIAHRNHDFSLALNSITDALRLMPALTPLTSNRPATQQAKPAMAEVHAPSGQPPEALTAGVLRLGNTERVRLQHSLKFEAMHQRVRNKYWDPQLYEILERGVQISQQGPRSTTLEEAIESSRLSLLDFSHPSSPAFARGTDAAVSAWIRHIPDGISISPLGKLASRHLQTLDHEMLGAVRARAAIDEEETAYWQRLANWRLAEPLSLETQPRIMARTAALNHLARQHLLAGDSSAAEQLLIRSLSLSGRRTEDLHINANIEALLLLQQAAPDKHKEQIGQYVRVGLERTQRLQSPDGGFGQLQGLVQAVTGKTMEEQIAPGDAAAVTAHLNQLSASPANQYLRQMFYRNQLGYSRVLQAMGRRQEATRLREQVLEHSGSGLEQSTSPGLMASYLAARAEARHALGDTVAAAEDYVASCRELLSLTRTELLLLEFNEGTHRPSETFDRAISAMAEQQRFAKAFYLIEAYRTVSAAGAVVDLQEPRSPQALERELSKLEQKALDRTRTGREREALASKIQSARQAAKEVPSGLGSWDMALARLHPLRGWIEPSQLLRTSAALESRARTDRAARTAERHQAKLKRAQAAKRQAERNSTSSTSVDNLQQRVNAQRQVALLRAASRGIVPLDHQRLINLELLRASMPGDGQLLSYWFGATSAHAFVLRPDAAKVIPLGKLERNRIVALVKRLPSGGTAELQELYQLLMAPVRPHLKGAHTWYVPDDVIHLVPLHALHDGQHHLFEVMELSRLHHASDLLLEKAPPHPVSSIAALAQPRPSGGATLLFSVAEVQDVIQLLPIQTIFFHPDATEGHLRDALKQANILHVAAHTELNSAWPVLSRLHMKADSDNDGSLEVHELLDLRAPRLELAVLSACDTSNVKVSLRRQRRGVGSELDSLASSLSAAGARSVVASLWPIHDESTASFFHHFYGALAQGETRVQAMNLARSALVNSERFSNPMYWAPFVLYGDHRALTFGQ